VHLDGTFFGSQRALALMKKSGKGGSIVNMSSVCGTRGVPSVLAYSAAKGGILSLSRAIAVHCKEKKYPIRCNTIIPGLLEN
jgi:3(or 17)beta-hydroxysteroid dehydrogenase